jgi:predicted dinucleotide-binding enzyme
MPKVAIIGVGNVGVAIATSLIKHGITVFAGVRDPTSAKVQAAIAHLPALKVSCPPGALQSGCTDMAA